MENCEGKKKKTYYLYYYTAVFIDLDQEREEEDENKVYSKWCELPDLVLEQIFGYLTIRQRYYASLVCKNWYQAFHFPKVWSRFVLEDDTLTRGRFNYYSGWQYVLDHLRTSMCLSAVGKNIKHLTFEPMLNFYNLYEFINMISWYIEQSDKHTAMPEYDGVGVKIRTLKFTFPCDMDMASRDETEMTRLFGTGGRLLGALKRLMANLSELKRLELIDLMLDSNEAQHLLDEVCVLRCLTLKTLILINATRIQYQILHVGVFLNLNVLKISPQNLGNDVIEMIGHTKLKHLHIVQNRFSPDDIIVKPALEQVWKQCRKNNPTLNVHLELESKKPKNILWQTGAPVKSILYHTPSMGVEYDSVMSIIEQYKEDILVYGHTELPRGYRPKSFDDRIDSTLLLLCRRCPKIKMLIITERISTSTVLLIARTAKNLKHLYIRGNAVIKKCDWPQSPEWTDEFYQWLKMSSKSYENVEREVQEILGGKKWKFMTDKEFKNLELDLYNETLYTNVN
ncbi:uncharacterized protein [Onthophagus taurus]|uniref:uncharacterized protein isoform X2 n=1 Tax=Onthophagus taurus TaxID=166361 RepID=UPI000C20480E|nr:uncharacterized protein LOC111427284 isoform X2 [Onthophagus taurus]